MNSLKQQPISKMNQFNILIVDDCQVASLFLSKLLILLGFTSVDRVKSYQQAIQICAKRRYSLLFIDYHLEQRLNGSELYDLLKTKGFIEPYSRVITVSGDHTTQTVLSTLSKGNGDYLCKPISKSSLSHKMTDAYQEYQLFKKLHLIGKEGDSTKLKQHIIALAKNKNINELDQYLFNTFKSNEKEDLIQLCLQPEFINRRNYILTRLQLENELKLTSPNELIKQATKLCKQHPLFASAFDFLSGLQIKQSHYEDALHSASNALALTPSVSSRALHTLKLALICNNKQSFLKAAHLLSNHLPIAEQAWCAYVAQAFNYFDEYIQNCLSGCDRKQLILEQKNFVRRSEYRLTAIQKKQLTILFSLNECKRLIKEGDIIKSKRVTLKTVKPFFDNLHQLDSVILVELMYLLSFYGDLWLLEKVNSVLKTKHQFNDYCIDALNVLKHDSELKESLEMLSSTLRITDDSNNLNIQSKYDAYKNALVQFPYSSEVCIGLLECYIQLSLDKPETICILVSLVHNMQLSEGLMKRRDTVLKKLHAHESYIEEKSDIHLALKTNSSFIKKDIKLLNSSRKNPTLVLP